MILQCYFDDSGSEPSDKAYILAGFIAPAENWVRFSDEWQAVLNKHPKIETFKTAAAHALDGEFGHGWNSSLIDQRALELTEVIDRNATYRIHCGLPWEDYNTFVSGITDSCTIGNPYFLCFFKLLSFIANRFPEDTIETIFDDQGAIGTRVLNFWDDWSTKTPGIFDKFENPIFRTDTKVTPLQAADLYAWHCQQDAMSQIAGKKNKSKQHIRKILSGIPEINCMIEPEELISLGCGLLVRRESRKRMTFEERLSEKPCPNCGGLHWPQYPK